MNDNQAQILREAVWWAEREVERDNVADGDTNAAGTWDQNYWARITGRTLTAAGVTAEAVQEAASLVDESGFIRVTCQTTGCIAGHVNQVVGRPLAVHPSDVLDALTFQWSSVHAEQVFLTDRPGETRTMGAPDSALQVLGLESSVIEDEDGNAYDLFDGDNTIEKVRLIAEMILESEGHPPVGEVPANFFFTPPAPTNT